MNKDILRLEFQKAIRTKRWFRWQYIAVALTFYCVFLSLMIDNIWVKYSVTAVNVSVAIYSIIQLRECKREEKIIEEKIRRLENDDEYFL